VRYHSETPATWALHTRNRAVEIRWYPEDIGAIAVRLGETWIEVPAVFARFSGVRAQTWLAAARQLRAQSRYNATFDEDAIFDAIRAIDAINGDAMRRIGLVADDWSAARVAREEESLFIGFQTDETRRNAPPRTQDTPFGEEIAAPGSHDPAAPTSPPAQGAMAPDATDHPDDTPGADGRDDDTGWEIVDT
jgi:putative transposase